MKYQYGDYANARLSGDFGEMSSWRLVKPFLLGKRVLDVGCSNGLYLRQLSKESQGIEQIDALAEAGRKQGLAITTGDLLPTIKEIPDQTFTGFYFRMSWNMSIPR